MLSLIQDLVTAPFRALALVRASHTFGWDGERPDNPWEPGDDEELWDDGDLPPRQCAAGLPEITDRRATRC